MRHLMKFTVVFSFALFLSLAILSPLDERSERVRNSQAEQLRLKDRGANEQLRSAAMRNVPALTRRFKAVQDVGGDRALADQRSLRARPGAWNRLGPEAYDLEAINSDPGYYERIDYTRFFQRSDLPPGQPRPPLLRRSLHRQMGKPDSWLPFDLIVEAEPGRPVTFWATRSGFFPNGASVITVKSDERTGLARTRFRLGPGQGEYPVMASSPENSGQVTWHLECSRDDRLVTAWRSRVESGIDRIDRGCNVVLKPDGLLVERNSRDRTQRDRR